MITVRNFMKVGLVSAAIALTGCAHNMHKNEPVKAAYHFNDGVAQAARGLNNIRNHLNADPTAKIVVVAHGTGIDFILNDAKTPKGQPFDSTIADLAAKGVEFRVCNNTLESRKLSAKDLDAHAVVVPSGVAEIATLQAKQGFVYVRP